MEGADGRLTAETFEIPVACEHLGSLHEPCLELEPEHEL